MNDEDEFENVCGYCGYDHGEVEIEYCDCDEHCEFCAQGCEGEDD